MAVSGAYLAWPYIARSVGGGQQIGTLEATRLINDNALVLDVRDAKDFATGRIPKAKHIPIVDLEKRLAEIARFKEKPIIVSGRNEIAAGQAIRLLAKNQFSKLYSLRGGLVAWREAGLPLEKS